MRIKINRDGTLDLLYTDAVNLHDIGEVKVRRASDVEYDHGRKGWTVRFTDGGWLGAGDALVKEEAAAAAFSARASALAAEVRFLERRL